MSTRHTACFKHLERNCKCTNLQLSLHHSIRVPKKGNVNDWKVFLKWLLFTRKVTVHRSDVNMNQLLAESIFYNYYKKQESRLIEYGKQVWSTYEIINILNKKKRR